MKVIALCSNVEPFDSGPIAWNNRTVTDQFPGSGWVHYLETYAKQEAISVLPGIEVLRRLLKKELNPEDIYVVQEEFNLLGNVLRENGAHASVLLCLESPLYVPRFYEYIPELKKVFKAQILFGDLGTHQAFFPSFDFGVPCNTPVWSDRTKDTCMVVSHKNLKSNDPNELQTKRYALIDAFKPMAGFDLYGKGWPEGYASQIPAGLKVEVISQYRYNLCLENYAMPGYITEKLIECLQAGCLPVYMGAPDVCNFVPAECFFDPNAGRDFIESQGGWKFSHQHFARQVLEIISNEGL